jgi:hypothetical protein
MIETGLIGGLAILALVDSTSFGTLFIPVWLLSTPKAPRIGRIGIYLITVFVLYFIVGILIMLGAGIVIERLGEFFETRAFAGFVLALGVFLFIWSFRYTRKNIDARKAAGKPSRLSRLRDRAMGMEDELGGKGAGGLTSLIVLALAAVSAEVATMFPYLAAIGVLNTSPLHHTARILLLMSYCVVMIFPAILLAIGRIVFSAKINPLLLRLNAWFERNGEYTAGWLFAIVGVVLALNAAGHFFPNSL